MAKPTSFKVGSAPWEQSESGKAQAFKVGEAPWEKQTAPESKSGTGVAQTTLEGFGQGASLGYLPQLQAMAQPITDRAFNLLPGPDVEPAPFRQMVPGSPEYIQARDENVARQQEQAKANPVASMAGQGAGILATSVIPGKLIAGGAKGAVAAKNAGSFVKGAAQVAKGAAIGGTEAAALNPGDTAGEFNPLQISERLDNAKIGALFGGGAGLASKAISAGVKGAKDASQKIAFKSSGAMLKDFRQAAGKNKINDLGQFMLDKILKAGDSFEDVAEKAQALKQQSGQEIGSIYKGVLKQVGDEQFWNKLDPAKKSALAMTGFKPAAQKVEILSAVNDALGHKTNKRAAMSFVSDYVDDLAAKYGNDLDIVTANAIKGDLDDAINYGKRVQDLPEKQEALFKLRSHIQDSIEQHIDVLDDIVGGDQVKKLREANKLYGSASQIQGIAHDRVQRESANRFFSLGDRVTGAAGVAGGAASGAILGGDLESTLKGAALGLGGAAASKVARKFGPHAAAKALEVASNAKGLATVPGAVTSSGVRAVNAPDYKKSEQNEISPPAEVLPQKGPSKWASDGVARLKSHDKSLSDEMIETLLATPKGKTLLIAASDLKPGTKAMTNLLEKIKTTVSKKGGS